MALNPETIDIGITGGVDLKTSSKRVAPPQVINADNVVLTTNGAVRKRYGFTAITPSILGGGGIITGLAIQSVNGELCLVDGQRFYAYSPATNSWTLKGSDSYPGLYSTPALVSFNKQGFPNSFGNTVFADIGNYRLVAIDNNPPDLITFTATNTLQIGLWDKVKGSWISAPASDSLLVGKIAVAPVVVAFGAYFYVFFITTSTSGTLGGLQASVWCYAINSSTIATSGFTLPTPKVVAESYNIAAGGGLRVGNNSFVDAWADSRQLITVFGFGVGFTTTAGATIGPAPGHYLVCTTVGSSPSAFNGVSGNYNNYLDTGITGRQTINGNTNYALIAGAYTPVAAVIDLQTYSVGAAVPYGMTTVYSQIAVGALGPTGTTCSAVVAIGGGALAGVQSNSYALGTVTAPRAISFTTAQAYPWANAGTPDYPVSKPFFTTGYSTFAVWTSNVGQVTTVLQPSIALQGLNNRVTMARGAYDVATPFNASAPQTTLPYVVPTTLEFTNVGANVLDFVAVSTAAAKQIVPLERGAFITGTEPQYYDGNTTRTLGFDGYPELTPTLTGTTGGSLTVSTPYTYTAIYRAFDNFGRLMLSSPGPFQTYTTGASERGISFTPGTLTAPWPIYGGVYDAVLYRNTAADPLNFRELTTLQGPSTTFSTFTDTVSDATLIANGLPFLYAPPTGELPNDPPPACTIAAASQNRLFVVSSENPARLYFTKPFDPARVPEFNADSYLVVDAPTGPITGLAVMDGKLIIFKSTCIYSMPVGGGPNALGQGAFEIISRVSSDSGALSQASILPTAAGVFFQSSRGIQLLNRSETVEYPGVYVETLTTGATVTAVVLLDAVSQVRFFISTGIVLVYDYLLQRWSTFSSTSGYYAVSACVWNGSQVALDTVNRNINLENTGFTDNGSAITMTLETPWLSFKGPQSLNRLRRVFILGDYKSANTATLSFAYDWNESYIDSVAFGSATGLVNGDNVFQWRTRAPRQTMQALKLKLVDSGTTGESYDLTNIGLEYSVKSGTAKLPSQKSV